MRPARSLFSVSLLSLPLLFIRLLFIDSAASVRRLRMSLWSILSGLALLWLPLHSAKAQDLNLPGLGDGLSAVVSRQQEYQMGQAWLRLYRHRAPLYQDPLVGHYLESLLERVAAASAQQLPPLTLVMVDNPSINAFAAPGGVVGVHSGLFLMAQREDEFASVLSHELAHLSQRHWVRSVAAAKENTVPTMAGLLAGLLLVATSNPQAGLATITTVQAANLESMLRFSRQNEQEADRLGLQTLLKAGFNADGMSSMFEQMLNAQRFQGKRPPEYLLSHPVTEKRIADARLREPSPLRQNVSTTESRYPFIRARLRLHHSESPQWAIKQFRGELEGLGELQREGMEKDASRYALALAYIQANQFEQAAALLESLAGQYPNEVLFPMAQAELAMMQGELDTAEQGLAALRTQHGRFFPADFLSAQIHKRAKRYPQAEQVLHQLSQQRPEDPQVWYELAEIRGLSKNIAGLHLARAEYFILTAVYDKARTQLEYAQALLKDNYIETERIKQRLNDIEQLENISLKI